MIVYRIAKEPHDEDMEGTGAKLFGGRWNRQGVAVLYTAAHISLSVLEMIVHVDDLQQVEGLHLLTLDIPDSLQMAEVRLAKLKKNWVDDVDYTQWMGTRFANDNQCVCLIVPSVVVPQEANFILNPAHKDFKKVKVVSNEKIQFDKRLIS
jgi:RES domain-containing protein